MINTSQLLYSYLNHNYLPPKDLVDDSILKSFIDKLSSENREELIALGSYSGTHPQHITLDALKREVSSNYLRLRVNERYKKQLTQISLGEFDDESLTSAFPELAGSDLSNAPRAVYAKDIVLEPIRFNSLYPAWDNIFSGIISTDYILIYGITSTGKSTLSCKIAVECIRNKKTVAFYSTEMTQSQSRAYIMGSMLGLLPHESVGYFERYPAKFEKMNSVLGNNLILASEDQFSWDCLEKMFVSEADVIFLDQMNTSLGDLGLDENEQNLSNFSGKLRALITKYKKPCFVVHQESYRPPTPKELETNPNLREVGLGVPRYATKIRMDITLGLLIKKNPMTGDRHLAITKDRFRGLDSLAEFYCELDRKTGDITGHKVVSKSLESKFKDLDVDSVLSNWEMS